MKAQSATDHLVAITGIGMVTPLGISTGECWVNMVAGKSGIDRIRRFDASDCLTRIGGELPDRYFEADTAMFAGTVHEQQIIPIRVSIYTARQAMTDAGVVLADVVPDRAAVITGCGGSTFGDDMVLNEAGHQRKRCNEMIDMLGAAVSRDFGFRGPSFNVATACASGAFAVCRAYDYVRCGGDLCIAVGIDTILVKETIDGFNSLMALTGHNEFPEKASRPFDKTRSGFVLSEGACAVVLEPYAKALARGARIYSLIAGYACTSEAFNIVAPEPEGQQMARTMEDALRNARLQPQDVGYISAHGTSTPHNDLAETKAIKRAFGDHAFRLAVSSQKSMVGHSIGAAGAIEVGVTALILHHRQLTPTINYEHPDPECDLDYVPNRSREAPDLMVALTNSFGFGGHNASIALQRGGDIG